MPKQRRPCDGLPRVCPGKCNPRNRPQQTTQSSGHHELAQFHEQNIVSHNVHYNPEFALFSRKTQTDLLRPLTPIMSDEEREIIDVITRRVQHRKRRRDRGRGHLLGKLVAFLIFFFVHGLIAAVAKDYSHYQTFLATQVCGFITIIFWDESAY